MKKNIFTLLFGLLLAVGWTNVAQAQALPMGGTLDRLRMTESTVQKAPETILMSDFRGEFQTRPANRATIKSDVPLRANNKPDVVKTKSYYDGLTYSWSNPETGDSGTDVPATEIATDPYQMYELLRFVYMDKRFPGPYYSAYTASGEREDPVYYGAVAGGWDIPDVAAPATYDDIVITPSSNAVNFKSIVVKSGDTEITYWRYPSTSLPSEWTCSSFTVNTTSYYSGYTSSTITIPGSLLTGYSDVQLVINAWGDSGNTSRTIRVGNETKTIVNGSESQASAEYTWNISSNSPSQYTITVPVMDDIVLTGNNYANVTKIEVKSGNNVITSFTADLTATTLPVGWTFNVAPGLANSDHSIIFGTNDNGEQSDLIITSDLLAGYSEVTISITAYNYPATQGYSGTTYPGYVYVNGSTTFTYTSANATTSNTTIQGNSVVVPVNNPNVYTPNEEGYTALIVALNNNITPAPETFPENDAVNSESYFNSKDEIINYFKNNVAYIQLLTDGLRIGTGLDEGTVFNCSGTYNKFFFLGKGQARKKDDLVLVRQQDFGYLLGERAPFKYMFEEFSPTGGEMGSQITDFYIEMMDGAVYSVIHDCASVIDNEHEFSMSGKNGTQDYAMSGMNFFIPDYRLQYWTDEYSFRRYTVDQNGDTTWYNYGPYTVDGRIMNPFNSVTGEVFDRVANYTANYAQYYPQRAPKVGLYTIALDAEAKPVNGWDAETNANYTVTLDWTSSLNEMSGSEVPQTYMIYEVVYVDGVETLVYIATVNDVTHYTFPDPFPQGATSQTHTYIIKGSPTDSQHPEFIAWSNQDAVIIPGLNDFLALGIDHYESDFDVPNVKNWYRNFLTIGNEDSNNGLTYDRIDAGEDLYTIYRFDYNNPTNEQPVASILFATNNNNTVDYLIEYENQDIEPDEDDKYELENMGIPTEGTLTVKAAGDITIMPNGYDVNFLSIRVQAGNYDQTWTSPSTTLPTGWSVSDGSMWVLEEGAYYLEGGGYILIPASVLGNYSTAKVTINAYGDPGKVAKITVNGTTHTLFNGESNAQNYVFNVAGSGGSKAPARAQSINLPIEVTDYITYANMSATSTSYSTFTGKTQNSGAVLAGNTARGGSATSGYNIQLNSNNQRGIVTTASGGNRIKSIKITVASGTNTISVYGKNTAYSSAADLYNNSNRGTLLGSTSTTGTITVSGDYKYFGIRSSSGAVYISSIEVVWETVETPAYDNLIDDWDYNVDGATMPANWTLTAGDIGSSSGAGNGDNGNSIWINSPGNITIPASICDGYENIKVVIMYGTDPTYTGTSTHYLTLNGSDQSSNSAIPFATYEWSDVDATNGITIAPNSGWLSIKSIRVYGDPVSVIPPTPSGDGLVRMDLQIVDQFSVDIPPTNDHPIRYGYVLRYEPNEGDAMESGTAEVPVQHTGANIGGYYTLDEMVADTDPTNFLQEDVLSAELNMTLSPTSAPYYYTINSKKNAAPADAWHNYVSVLQRREAGDYQEMQNPSPYNGNIYVAGPHEFFDFRKVVAESKDDYLTYVPIVWTKGIDRRYYVEDSLHNSYGAPIWEVHPGDVTINNSVVQRQARWNAATNSWDWNASVNYTVDDVPYSLYFVDVTATGILPQNTAIEYEPYMFRIWLVDSTESMRDYTWAYNDDDEPIHIVDGGAISGAWKLLDTKMCNNYVTQDGTTVYEPDLVYEKSITTDYANNLQFVAPIENYHPIIMVRFYFKVKGSSAVVSGLRGEGEDNVGHVALRGTNPQDPSTGIAELVITGEVVSQTYYNVQGMQSDKPFDGLNIVVTRYSNGTVTTTKVVR